MRWLSAQGTRLTQPQGAARVALDNPIAARLSALAIPGQGGVKLHSRVRPVEPFATISGTGINVAAGPGGVGAGPASALTTHAVRLSAAANPSLSAWYEPTSQATWLVVLVRHGNNTNGNAPIFLCGSPGTAPYSAYGIVDGGGTGSLRFECSAGGAYRSLTAGAFTGRRQVIVGRYNGSALEGFSDGVRVAGSTSCSGSLSYPTAADAGPAVGNFFDYPDGARSFNGRIFLAAVWPVALSDAEIAVISANPWQLFEPERRIWVPVVAGGGSSTNLVIQSALHAHTADGPTLTTDSTLAVSDALHAHSADALTLGTDLLLAVDDASHAHSAEALTLDIGTALVVADATHGHTADGLTLATDSFLAVADALHGHTADNLTLTADGAVDLVIQDALHAHTADELTLSVTGAGGYYDDDPKRAPRKAKKLTVIHKDDSDERSQEFEALLARVKGQALDKAKSAAQAAPVATPPADIKAPRMPEIRGVEASLLRQWMPDLLSTYRATFTAELQALASAQQAAAQAQMRALQRQQYEDEEIAILAMLA